MREIEKDRFKEASAYHNQCLLEMKKKPIPKGQKYPPGTRVFISNEMPPWMSHFEKGKFGTIKYTYTHMYIDQRDPEYNDLKSKHSKTYSIDIDGVGNFAWYDEYLLELEEDKIRRS